MQGTQRARCEHDFFDVEFHHRTQWNRRGRWWRCCRQRSTLCEASSSVVACRESDKRRSRRFTTFATIAITSFMVRRMIHETMKLPSDDESTELFGDALSIAAILQGRKPFVKRSNCAPSLGHRLSTHPWLSASVATTSGRGRCSVMSARTTMKDQRKTARVRTPEPLTMEVSAIVGSGECVTDVEFQLLQSAGDGCRSRAVRFLLVLLSSKDSACGHGTLASVGRRPQHDECWRKGNQTSWFCFCLHGALCRCSSHRPGCVME